MFSQQFTFRGLSWPEYTDRPLVLGLDTQPLPAFLVVLQGKRAPPLPRKFRLRAVHLHIPPLRQMLPLQFYPQVDIMAYFRGYRGRYLVGRCQGIYVSFPYDGLTLQGDYDWEHIQMQLLFTLQDHQGGQVQVPYHRPIVIRFDQEFRMKLHRARQRNELQPFPAPPKMFLFSQYYDQGKIFLRLNPNVWSLVQRNEDAGFQASDFSDDSEALGTLPSALSPKITSGALFRPSIKTDKN
jgi:hypothetical protein